MIAKRQGGPGGPSKSSGRRGGSEKVYLHAVPDEKADLLNPAGAQSLIQAIERKSGALVRLKEGASSVEGMKICVIRGDSFQIKEAVKLIDQQTGVQDVVLRVKQLTTSNWQTLKMYGKYSKYSWNPRVRLRKVRYAAIPELKKVNVGEHIAKGGATDEGDIVKVKMSEQAEKFWLQWTEEAFPDLGSKAYFLPPVFVNRVPMTRESVAGQEVFVYNSAAGQSAQARQQAALPAAADQPPRVQDSDTRDDAAMQRVLLCLREMAKQNEETLVGISQLLFQNYLGSQFYSAAAEQLLRPANLPQPPNWRRGDFDVLIIHRHYGVVVLEVKSFDVGLIATTAQQDTNDNIREKLRAVVTQLDKAQAVFSHLVSDVTPGLRITKAMAFPNLASSLVQQSIEGDHQLTQDLCRCLGAKDLSGVIGLCLWSDQLPDLSTPWRVSDSVMTKVQNWWKLRVAASGPDSHMTLDNYKTLVARFCGPATTVTVPCTSLPRLCVKTISQAVSLTGERYADIALFPEQADLLNRAPPRMLLAGPPGTGKTVVLQLIASRWQKCGKDFYIMSSWYRSRAACRMLHRLLQQSQANGAVTLGRIQLKEYEFSNGRDVEKAVSDFHNAAKGDLLFVIADEVGFDDRQESHHFQAFCTRLLKLVPRLHLWAASCYHKDVPLGWELNCLTRPLRSPPAVVREVEQDRRIGELGSVPPYGQRGVPDHTDGPPVEWIRHQGKGHTADQVRDCPACSQQVVRFLQSLRIGVPASTYDIAPPALQYRDVLVLDWGSVNPNAAVVMKIKEAEIPVKVMKDDSDLEDVATARSEVVWVAEASRIRGLERKVVVCLAKDRFHGMSRCTSQLVVVSG